MNYPTHWRDGDLLDWSEAQDGADPALDQPDILHSAFAIHHLNDAQKSRFLDGARRRIQPGGLFIWVDVFREPAESRNTFIARCSQRISSSWPQLNAEQQEHVIAHLSQFDLPADRAASQECAEAAGWNWQRAWQGHHLAEAIAVLTPV